MILRRPFFAFFTIFIFGHNVFGMSSPDENSNDILMRTGRLPGSFWDRTPDSSTEHSVTSSPVASPAASPSKRLGKKESTSPKRLKLNASLSKEDYDIVRFLKFSDDENSDIEESSSGEVYINKLDVAAVMSCFQVADRQKKETIYKEHSERLSELLKDKNRSDGNNYDDLETLPLLRLCCHMGTFLGYGKINLNKQLCLPLLNIQHIVEGDINGGYHLEKRDDTRNVKTLIMHGLTKVYGGSISDGSHNNKKYSSFFPIDFTQNRVMEAIQMAYSRPHIENGGDLIGTSVDAGTIHMYVEPNGLVLRSAFPIIEFLSLDNAITTPYVITHVKADDDELKPRNYSKSQLYEIAKHEKAREVLSTENSKIVDIAAALTGYEEARGVYLELPLDAQKAIKD